jgi:hypothetical protein
VDLKTTKEEGMSRTGRLLLILAVALPLALASTGPAVAGDALSVSEFKIDYDTMCSIRDQWVEEQLQRHPEGGWAPMEFHPTDQQLEAMGLPSAGVLASRRYDVPTLVTKSGDTVRLDPQEFETALLPALATYAGNGCLGIRPGAWLLLISGNSIGWCSMAHVYGSPGNYDISTAGHCGRNGDTATVIAAFGNRDGLAGPVLLDFGTFRNSHDGGLGNDWALIDIFSRYQSLVTPTMCFWGGPRGMYTKTGGVATVSWGGGGPNVTVNPDPFLAQAVVHYGHGLGTGPGGTPRAGTAIHWGNTHFMFFGAISFGDSGSGANTLTGDSVGSNMEAAGIMTHLYIDPLMRQGLGIMGGTRATAVSGTLANGQIVPYPIPISGLP